MSTNDKLAFCVMAVVVVLLGAFYAEFGILESRVSHGDTVYVTEASIFRECFKEPFERIAFVMKDGNAITYTTHDEYCVATSYGRIRYSLKEKGYQISDVIFCIHNHLISPFFSKADKDFCRWMRNDGFTGIFAIYHYPSKGVIPYEN